MKSKIYLIVRITTSQPGNQGQCDGAKSPVNPSSQALAEVFQPTEEMMVKEVMLWLEVEVLRYRNKASKSSKPSRTETEGQTL